MPGLRDSQVQMYDNPVVLEQDLIEDRQTEENLQLVFNVNGETYQNTVESDLVQLDDCEEKETEKAGISIEAL